MSAASFLHSSFLQHRDRLKQLHVLVLGQLGQLMHALQQACAVLGVTDAHLHDLGSGQGQDGPHGVAALSQEQRQVLGQAQAVEPLLHRLGASQVFVHPGGWFCLGLHISPGQGSTANDDNNDEMITMIN